MKNIEKTVLETIGLILNNHPHLANEVEALAKQAKEKLAVPSAPRPQIANKKEDLFTMIFETNMWANEESVSGDGSSLRYTENLRKQMPIIFRDLGIETVFDAPCGDFNWMRHVVKDYPINYIGGDIVATLVDKLNQEHGNARTVFKHIDLTEQLFPDADMMMCRDCLFHLPYVEAKKIFQNFVDSNIKYLFTTSHITLQGFTNVDVHLGGFALMNLGLPPYNFPKDAIYRVEDYIQGYPPREMVLWSKEQVIEGLKNFVI